MADNGRETDPIVQPAVDSTTEIFDHEPTVRLDRVIINGDPTLPTAFGRYRVVRRIGVGGFASVYAAVDPDLQSQVAVKVLAENHSADVEVRRRFVAEARVARRLASDRLINVFDLGETGDGRPYVVMELADRGTLGMRLEQIGRPGELCLIRLIEELGACLDAIHSKGVVHRDLKPSNLLLRSLRGAREPGSPSVLIGPDEQLVLADFGLARDISSGVSGLTVGGGTAGYMAPEQADPSGRADHRADLYAATVVVAELTTLRHPERLDLATAGLAPDVLGALQQGMAINRDDRPTDAGAWRRLMLDAYRSGPALPGGTVEVSEAPTVINRTRIQTPARYDDPEAYTPIPGDEEIGRAVPILDGRRPGPDEAPPPPPPTIAAPPGFHRPPPGAVNDPPRAPVTADSVRAWIAATRSAGTTDLEQAGPGHTEATRRVRPDDHPGPTTTPDSEHTEATRRVRPGDEPAHPDEHAETRVMREARPVTGSDGSKTELLSPRGDGSRTEILPLALRPDEPLPRAAPPGRPTPTPTPTPQPTSRAGDPRTAADPRTRRQQPQPQQPQPQAAGPPVSGRPSAAGAPISGLSADRAARRSSGSGPSAADPRYAPPPTSAPPWQTGPPVGQAPPARPGPAHQVAAGTQPAVPSFQAPPPRAEQLVMPAPPGPAPVVVPAPGTARPPGGPERQRPPSRKQARHQEKQSRRDEKARARERRRQRRRRRWRRIANVFIGLIRGCLATVLAVVAATLLLSYRLGARPDALGREAEEMIVLAGGAAFVLGILIFPFPRYLRSRRRD